MKKKHLRMEKNEVHIKVSYYIEHICTFFVTFFSATMWYSTIHAVCGVYNIVDFLVDYSTNLKLGKRQNLLELLQNTFS
jgi:hypothetical protein